MDRYQYLILMGICLVITLPLEFVFRARVWRRPRRLWRALWPTVAVFVVWDVVAIARGHWTYSDRYLTGLRLAVDVGHQALRLPIEELVFFLIIPICGILTFETVKRVLGDR